MLMRFILLGPQFPRESAHTLIFLQIFSLQVLLSMNMIVFNTIVFLSCTQCTINMGESGVQYPLAQSTTYLSDFPAK